MAIYIFLEEDENLEKTFPILGTIESLRIRGTVARLHATWRGYLPPSPCLVDG
jgi:hypothetical protein